MPWNRELSDRTLTLGGVRVDMGYLDSLEEQQGASNRNVEGREGDGEGMETDVDTSSSSSSSLLLLSTESADIQEGRSAVDIGSGGHHVGSTAATSAHQHRPPSPLALAEEMYSSFDSSTYSSISIDSISDSDSDSSTVELMDVYNELAGHDEVHATTSSSPPPPPDCRQQYDDDDDDDDEAQSWEEDKKGGGWVQNMSSGDGLLSLILPHSDHFSLLVYVCCLLCFFCDGSGTCTNCVSTPENRNTIAVSCVSTAILFTYALFFPCE